jgi:hypothetical protein
MPMDKKEKEEIVKELTEKFEKVPKEEAIQIWAECGRRLTNAGVADGTDVIIADELPDLSYLGEKDLALVALGKKVGRRAVYMVKKWLKNQWVTILILHGVMLATMLHARQFRLFRIGTINLSLKGRQMTAPALFLTQPGKPIGTCLSGKELRLTRPIICLTPLLERRLFPLVA